MRCVKHLHKTANNFFSGRGQQSLTFKSILSTSFNTVFLLKYGALNSTSLVFKTPLCPPHFFLFRKFRFKLKKIQWDRYTHTHTYIERKNRSEYTFTANSNKGFLQYLVFTIEDYLNDVLSSIYCCSVNQRPLGKWENIFILQAARWD